MELSLAINLVLLVLLVGTALFATIPVRRDLRPWIAVVTLVLIILMVGISFNN